MRLDLTRIDLGKDEAEIDARLSEYFLRTEQYKRAKDGSKSIIIGRKGAGKSAIFAQLSKELPNEGTHVVTVTPDQYSWSALRDYEEKGILPQQAHTNAWKMTLLSAVVWKLNEQGLVKKSSPLFKYYQYMRDAFAPGRDDWLYNLIEKAKRALAGIKTQWVSFEFSGSVATPLRVIEELIYWLETERPNASVRLLADRLDDSWDGSERSRFLIVGLLKAAHDINARMNGRITTTVFLRSDIYDNLFFDDQDKLRQHEEPLRWSDEELKAVVAERVRVSLHLEGKPPGAIWRGLFSNRPYRSRASAEKYIIDRTFKRPRDIISFVRFALEQAIQNAHGTIEPEDTRTAEETVYSQSKYKDLIIEYKKTVPYIKELLDAFSGRLHRLSAREIEEIVSSVLNRGNQREQPSSVLRHLFSMGVIGIKKQGRAGLSQRGGAHFYYYYDDPSVNPIQHDQFYVHPSLRQYLNIRERRGG